MNAAGPVALPIVILNPGVELNTMPVGAPWGIATLSPPIAGTLPRTPPVYRLDTSAPLLLIHSGVVGPAAMPHGFTRFGSVIRATPSISEIRLTRL